MFTIKVHVFIYKSDESGHHPIKTAHGRARKDMALSLEFRTRGKMALACEQHPSPYPSNNPPSALVDCFIVPQDLETASPPSSLSRDF